LLFDLLELSMEKLNVQQIGRYRVLNVIGKGGMGIVYRAIDTKIERTVAIKMLLNIHAEDKDLLARFDQEVRSTANLQHRNIVTVYAVDDYQGSPYMVMEYLEGQSMSEMILSRRPMHLVEKLSLISQVCEGLQYAHQREVIHRDIKPANILVLKDGTAKIVDFGIARAGRGESITRTGQVVGSVHYMSPEQIRGGVVDCRTDIYSTGVTLFQLLTGEVPFKSTGNDAQDPLLKVLNEPLPSLSKHLPSFPAHLDEIIQTATAKGADERYQTAEDLGYDLARLQENLKHDMIADFLVQAQADVEQREFESARQKLQEIFRLDRRHSGANELFHVVREKIQQQQRSIQVVNLRSQAEIALSGARYEEALDYIDQACRLDSKNQDLAAFSSSVREQVAKAREIGEALRRGQGALFAGDLEEAGLAVHRALELDSNHAEARALDSLLNKEIEERARRARLQKFIDKARQEIASRDYSSAIASLEEAQSIDPQDSDIRELLNWAQRGHEQETQRRELRRSIDEIGQLIRESRYADALESCETALRQFPADKSLEKLRELAQRQNEAAKAKRAVEKTCAEARLLVDQDRSDEAIQVLEKALEHFPDSLNLKALLSLTISENERRRQEQEERERKLQDLLAEQKLREDEPLPHEVLSLMSHLQEGMRENRSIHDLRALADELRTFQAGLSEPSIVLTLTEFDRRLAARERDLADLGEIADTTGKTRRLVELDSLADRARAIFIRHRSDAEIEDRYTMIISIIDGLRAERDQVSAKILQRVRAMQDCQDLEELKRRSEEVRDFSSRWLDDPQIHSLIEQASAYVAGARERKERVLKELNQFTETISTVGSRSQIRTIEEQARMLSSECNDGDVTRLLRKLEATAEAKEKMFDNTASRLRELTTRIEAARAISQVEQCELELRDLIARESLSEEDTILSRRIERRCAEKRTRFEEAQQVALHSEEPHISSARNNSEPPLEQALGGSDKIGSGNWSVASDAQNQGSHEKTPSPSMMPVSRGAAPPKARSEAGAVRFDEELLHSVERQLASFIGPLAKILVKHAATEATDTGDLYNILASKLESERDQKAFLAKRSEAGVSHSADPPSSASARRQAESKTPLPAPISASGEISATAVEQAGNSLAVFVGPIAKVLARKEAKRASSLRNLYELLGEHVADPAERRRFLRMAGASKETPS
jgi:serine/threonine-protein kinase